MARPLSELKRGAILQSAIHAVASLGLAAPTTKIARDAGVGDGTLFVYFPTKADLLNQLLLHIKTDLRTSVEAELALSGDLKSWLRRFWDGYIAWGLRSPDMYRAMRQLDVSDALTVETRQRAETMFSGFDEMIRQGLRSRVLRDMPPGFVGGLTDAIAALVLERTRISPEKSVEERRLGWEALWSAITTDK